MKGFMNCLAGVLQCVIILMFVASLLMLPANNARLEAGFERKFVSLNKRK